MKYILQPYIAFLYYSSMEETPKILAVYTVVVDIEPMTTGSTTRETWRDQNGDIHRDNDLPARIYRDAKTGEINERHWYQNGMLHRDNDQPAIIDDDSSNLYYINGVQHREKGPAEYYETDEGLRLSEYYYINGKFHREDGPACLSRCSITGVVGSESYWINGELSRDDGPASIERWEDTGIATLEEWYKDGELYRPDGKPPIIERDRETGVITKEAYEHEAKQKPSAPLPSQPILEP